MSQPVFTIRCVSGPSDTLTNEISIYADGRVSGITGNFQVINRLPEATAKTFQEGIAKGREVERRVHAKMASVSSFCGSGGDTGADDTTVYAMPRNDHRTPSERRAYLDGYKSGRKDGRKEGKADAEATTVSNPELFSFMRDFFNLKPRK